MQRLCATANASQGVAGEQQFNVPAWSFLYEDVSEGESSSSDSEEGLLETSRDHLELAASPASLKKGFTRASKLGERHEGPRPSLFSKQERPSKRMRKGGEMCPTTSSSSCAVSLSEITAPGPLPEAFLAEQEEEGLRCLVGELGSLKGHEATDSCSGQKLKHRPGPRISLRNDSSLGSPSKGLPTSTATCGKGPVKTVLLPRVFTQSHPNSGTSSENTTKKAALIAPMREEAKIRANKRGFADVTQGDCVRREFDQLGISALGLKEGSLYLC